MPIDLKKEIKLSDLFRRSSGPTSEDTGEETPTPEKEKTPRKSFSFSRGPKEPKEPKAPKEPKEPKEPKAPRARKEKKQKAAVAAKAAPPPPAVPLMRAFNLMPKEEAGEKTTISPAMTKVAVALLGVLVVAGLGFMYMTSSAKVADNRAEADAARAELAQLTAQIGPEAADPSASLAGESQARTAALADALGARVAWDRILREFSLVIPPSVVLSTLGVSSGAEGSADPATAATAGAPTFRIEGTATSQIAVAVLLSRLEVIPEFVDVRLESSSSADDEGGYQFAITATIAPEGAPTE
jgi:Tfp pilus assembly protein PilN